MYFHTLSRPKVERINQRDWHHTKIRFHQSSYWRMFFDAVGLSILKTIYIYIFIYFFHYFPITKRKKFYLPSLNFQFSTTTLFHAFSLNRSDRSAGTTGMLKNRSHSLSDPRSCSRSSSKGQRWHWKKISRIRFGKQQSNCRRRKQMRKTPRRGQFWRCWERAVVVCFCWKASEEFNFHSIISKMFVSCCVHI